MPLTCPRPLGPLYYVTTHSLRDQLGSSFRHFLLAQKPTAHHANTSPSLLKVRAGFTGPACVGFEYGYSSLPRVPAFIKGSCHFVIEVLGGCALSPLPRKLRVFMG